MDSKHSSIEVSYFIFLGDFQFCLNYIFMIDPLVVTDSELVSQKLKF